MRARHSRHRRQSNVSKHAWPFPESRHTELLLRLYPRPPTLRRSQHGGRTAGTQSRHRPHHSTLRSPCLQAREVTTSDVELLTRLEQLVTEGARAQQSSPAWSRASAPLSPALLSKWAVQNGERGDQDLAQRFEQLQRTVRELAATVSAQAARHRDESQAQWRERTTSPTQRVVVIKRSDESSTTPRAFWERSRLGRFHLKTGR